MKVRIVSIIIPLLLLAGCGIPFNRPAVSPDGTIAFFLDRSGTYDFLPEGGTLTLIKGGEVLQIPGAEAVGDCGGVSWAPDGKELVFVDTDLGDWQLPIAWRIKVTRVQTDSVAATLISSGSPLIGPTFTPEGNITYIEMDDNGYGHLFIYDRVEGVTYPLLDNVLSYRPAKSGSYLWVIKESEEGSLRMGHLIRYEPETSNEEEIASFYLGGRMDETLLLFPAPFLWDIDPSGKYIALSLFDQAVITPEVDTQDTSLYLIDVKDDSATRISTRGIAPAFSPDGKHLAYIGSEDGKSQTTFIYDCFTQEQKKVPVTDSTVGLFWIGTGQLGLIMEEQTGSSLEAAPSDTHNEEGDNYYLLKFDLKAGEVTPLLGE